MNKLSIEEALTVKLGLPWKVSSPTGTRFLVARRRPEDLTKELFEQLEAYGIARNTIRELFYILPDDWKETRERLGVSPGKRGGARPGCGRKSDTITGLPAATSGPDNDTPIAFAPAESRLKTTPPIGLPKVPVAPLLRAHDIGKPVPVTPEPKPLSAAAQFAEMSMPLDPTEDTDGLNYQDRHNLGMDDAGSDTADETRKTALEFFDGPNGCGTRKITIPDPPPNTAKLQITCHDYSLGQLKNILASLPAGTTISGTIHIAL